MNKQSVKKYLPWVLALFIAVVFVQSLFFKFSNSFETQYIFGTIGQWMQTLPVLSLFAGVFAAYGGYVIGTVELIASVLLLFRRSQAVGAIIACLVMSGAIFFLLFTPLGVSVVINEAGDRDGGQLFGLAVLVWFSAITVAWLRRQQLPMLRSGYSAVTPEIVNG